MKILFTIKTINIIKLKKKFIIIYLIQIKKQKILFHHILQIFQIYLTIIIMENMGFQMIIIQNHLEQIEIE